MNYRPYPKYKPSGIDWLGDIPEEWKFGRCGDTTNIIVGFAFDSGKFSFYSGVPLVRIRDIDNQEAVVNFDGAYDDKYLISNGDTLIGMDGDFHVRIWRGKPALLNQRVLKIKAIKNFDQRYLTYLLPFPINAINDITYSTTVKHLSEYDVKKIHFYIPDIRTQKNIADFLDRETGNIDQIIDKNNHLIELLHEKRQAVITRAVTKGLDPHTKLKPSGIDWLGDIPEEWNALPLKRVVGIKITDGPHETPVILDEGVNFISAEAVKNEKINFELRRGYISEELHRLFSKKCKPHKNDIFFIKSGATTGNIAIVEVDFEFSIWSPLALIRADEKKSQYKFLFYSLLGKLFHDQVEFSWSYGTQQNIGMKVLENLIVTLPSYPLQKKIADFLDYETAKINEIVSKVKIKNQKLQEFRQALISNAVTGKIRVN